MFSLPELHFDRLSFWLGFLAASLLWWLGGRLRPLIPVWREQIRGYVNKIRQKSLAGVEGYIIEQAVRRAQSAHIASALFSLDEILIQPRLIAPPLGQDPTILHSNPSIAGQVIPYLPDWPEISAPFAIPTLSLVQAVQNGRNIVVIGQPGAGKTVALAHLASELARNASPGAGQTGFVPIYTHILNLVLDPESISVPLNVLIKDISGKAGVLLHRQFTNFLTAVLEDQHRRLILILDGLDELPPERLKEAVQFLSILQKEYPRLQVITTASPTYLDGLAGLGYLPLGIAAWTSQQRLDFAQKWCRLWEKYVEPETRKLAGQNNIEAAMFGYWLAGEETSYLSPLEWTLRLWGGYAGHLSGCTPMQIFQEHISRFLLDPGQLQVLALLAADMVGKQAASIGFDEIDRWVSTHRPGKIATQESQLPGEEVVSGSTPTSKNRRGGNAARRDRMLSFSEQMVDLLVDGGIMVEHASGQVGFSNPAFYGFLAAAGLAGESASSLTAHLQWSSAVETLHFVSARSEQPAWILPLIENSAPPLFTSLTIISRWLRDASPAAGWKVQLMRSLVGKIQDDGCPTSIRLKFAAAFYLSRDPSSGKLFRRLLASPSPDIRRIALISCGALGSPQSLNDILGLLADLESDVRLTACLALAAIPGESSLNALVEILMGGDEEVRLAASEALAGNQAQGHKLLEEAVAIDDLLTRRASVFGLARIEAPWARKVLERVAVEDSQWVVRNAAAHALEIDQSNNPFQPQQLTPPWELPWLLTFSSKFGMGITPGQDAVDIFLAVLKSGSIEEQVAALHYLRDHPSEAVVDAIYQLLNDENKSLHEPAVQALSWINMSGETISMPSNSGVYSA